MKTSKQIQIDKIEGYQNGSFLSDMPILDFLETLSGNEINFTFIKLWDHKVYIRENMSKTDAIIQMKKLLAEDYDPDTKYVMPVSPEWWDKLGHEQGTKL